VALALAVALAVAVSIAPSPKSRGRPCTAASRASPRDQPSPRKAQAEVTCCTKLVSQSPQRLQESFAGYAAGHGPRIGNALDGEGCELEEEDALGGSNGVLHPIPCHCHLPQSLLLLVVPLMVLVLVLLLLLLLLLLRFLRTTNAVGDHVDSDGESSSERRSPVMGRAIEREEHGSLEGWNTDRKQLHLLFNWSVTFRNRML
jgi:hypothetical protein